MVIVPSFFNIFQVWIQDNFLKKAEFSEDIEIDIEDDALRGEVYLFQINNRENNAFNGGKAKKIEDAGLKNEVDETKDSKLNN